MICQLDKISAATKKIDTLVSERTFYVKIGRYNSGVLTFLRIVMSSGFTLKLSVLRSSAGFEDAFVALRNALCSSSTSSNSSSSASKQVWAQKGEFDEVDEEHNAFLKATKASSNPADDRNTDNLRVKPEDITILRKVSTPELYSYLYTEGPF